MNKGTALLAWIAIDFVIGLFVVKYITMPAVAQLVNAANIFGSVHAR